VEDNTTKARQLWIAGVVAALVLFVGFVTAPLSGEGDPNKRKVREAVYGNRPLGLPWLVVHVTTCAVIFIPTPCCIVNTIRVLLAANDLGAGKHGPLLWRFFSSYCATTFMPELQRPRFWMKLTWAWFFACFLGWIVLTSILGV
jgi:hypothetical protein